MMKKINIMFAFIGLALSVLCYLSTNSLLFAGLLFLIFIVDYLLLIRKRFVHYFSLIERVHASYHFINSFIITLSVKESLEDAYQNGIRLRNPRLNALTQQLTEMSAIERIKYLKDYFNLSIYLMFLNVIALYQDQGGNILSMSDNLMKECTRTERTLSETLSIGHRHLKEFITLWILSLAILVFMKYSLKDFYVTMLKNNLFGMLLFVFFLICVVSINLFVIAFTDITVKEAKND